MQHFLLVLVFQLEFLLIQLVLLLIVIVYVNRLFDWVAVTEQILPEVQLDDLQHRQRGVSVDVWLGLSYLLRLRLVVMLHLDGQSFSRGFCYVELLSTAWLKSDWGYFLRLPLWFGMRGWRGWIGLRLVFSVVEEDVGDINSGAVIGVIKGDHVEMCIIAGILLLGVLLGSSPLQDLLVRTAHYNQIIFNAL